jgi:predicted phage terminase large subunit-like protein
VTRALLWAAKAEAGKVILVRGPWIDEFLEEVCGFPNGTHDDQVDAMSLAFRMMSERRNISAGF